MPVGGGGGSRVREREQGERRSERVRGGVASFQGIQTRRGEAGRQASWWRGAVARARAGHTPLPLSRTKTTEEGDGLGRLLAGPASWLGQSRQVRGPGKVSLFYLFLFSNF